MARGKEKWVTTCDQSDRKVWIVPVINPQGVIKYPRVSPHIGASLFTVVYDERTMDIRLADVSFKPGLEAQGWAFVADDFANHDMSAAWPAFQKWMRTTPMMGATEPVKPFPAKYMPPGCAERIEGCARHQVEEEEISIPELDGRPAHTSTKKRRAAGVE